MKSPCRLVDEIFERVLHWLERADAQLTVEAIGEGLEVDIGRVHAGEEALARLLGDEACRDGHVLHRSW